MVDRRGATEVFGRYLQDNELEYDFLPPAAVDDNIKFLDSDIREKETRVEHAEKEHQENKERVLVMQEHLKNVEQELVNTQQLCEAKVKEIETEGHLKALTERETGRILQEIAKMERENFELQDRLNIIQNNIFRGNEKMDQFKIQMNWNQEELDQWALAGKQKEEDNMAMLKYTRIDEGKIKEMVLASEKLQKEVNQKKVMLENEVTETQAAQIELDKTAEDFRSLHRERQDLVVQWETAIDAMKRRDRTIQEGREKLMSIKEEVRDREEVLQEKKDFYLNQQAENESVQRQIQEAERVVQKYRATQTQEQASLVALQDELEVVRGTLAKCAADLQQAKVRVSNSRDMLEAKKEKLEAVRKKNADVKRRLEQEYLTTADLEKNAKQIHQLHKEEEVRLKATEKELQELKQEMFKKSQALFNLRKEEANLIAEISGAHTADRNLRDMIKLLDNQSQKQQELIYTADFQLQQMERKVSRAQGEYLASEKDALMAEIANLEAVMEEQKEQEKMLNRQLKKVNDDVRGAARRLRVMQDEKAGLDDKLSELQLENDVVTRALKTSVKHKEDCIVNHDLLRLEVKKLKDILNMKADEVFSLENRKYQLQRSMEERAAEVKVQLDILRADLKMAEDERHKIVMDLRERELKVATLKKKYELLVDKMNQELGDESERKSPAYYVVLRAQEREELQREGDLIDAKIQKTEREIRALENTLARLNAKNQRFRSSFHKVDTNSADFQLKEELGDKLVKLGDKRRAKKNDLDQVQTDVQELKHRLSNLQQERDGMERHISLIQRRADQAKKECEDYQQKKDRAMKMHAKLAKELRKKRKAQEGEKLLEEQDFELLDIKEGNKQMLYTLMSVADEAPELREPIEQMLQQHNIQPPSRPQSVAGSISDLGSARSSQSSSSRVSGASAASSRRSGR
mmetsp:Transcript_12121/g.27996  ORF Transcript_12121/g.27996 Transcript_12121/m.27996 type:complete len:922 (-) Transcript_12121:343-3108(-)|eukprot:CAMPEP_0114555608 /NCGR_PEP_ID=MMETSP0114-20121206/8843_1 /TAXON_ID=31324 /ORGANISM="Goniomonas sp, Strain m" /LENGTH=921 /DNA_ID=CAMNT_0001740751 /DNA_START=76 /DNA_END=2841 /DNA_ORIENTATION=+